MSDMKYEVRGVKSTASTDITLDDVLSSDVEPSAEAIQEFIEAERAASREMYGELNGNFIKKHMSDADIIFVSEYSPVVIASLTLSDVLNLAKSDDTLEFDYCNEDTGVELDNSTVAAKAKKVQNDFGYTGSSVKIGQIENDIPDVSNSQLSSIKSKIYLKGSGEGNYIEHATGVVCILVGQSDGIYPKGIAPGAELYSAPCKIDDEVSCYESIEWLLSNGVNVINASHSHGADKNTYSTYSIWLDHIANNHYITFVKSSGNLRISGVTGGGMAYNVITVGSVDDQNTPEVSDDTLSDFSSYYNASTGLAFKPDLCAPGSNIRSSVYPGGNNGTSFATPHVTGAIALLFEAKPVLKLKPAVVKSLLTLL